MYYTYHSFSESYITIDYLYTTGTKNILRDSFEHLKTDEIKYIKSIEVNETHAFFCLHYSSGKVECFLYEAFKSITVMIYEKKCLTEFYALKVYYFYDKKEYGFSCTAGRLAGPPARPARPLHACAHTQSQDIRVTTVRRNCIHKWHEPTFEIYYA